MTIKKQGTAHTIPGRRTRWLWIVLTVCLLALPLLWLLGPKLKSDYEIRHFHFADATPERIQSFVAAREAAREDVRPGLAGRVILHPGSSERTPWAIVYLHGFSASPREVYPLVETLADRMGAHVYLPRLSGHGLDPDGLGQEASLQAWMDDAMESLAIGSVLADRLLLIGYSNGANLALLASIHAQAAMQPEGLVLLAPNFQPADPSARFLTWPWAHVWVPLWIGPERVREALHDAHASGWSMRYATRALFPMMASVLAVRDAPLENLQIPLMLAYATSDSIIDTATIPRKFERIGSANKSLLTLEAVDDPSGHIIAGDAFSPSSTAEVIALLQSFADALP